MLPSGGKTEQCSCPGSAIASISQQPAYPGLVYFNLFLTKMARKQGHIGGIGSISDIYDWIKRVRRALFRPYDASVMNLEWPSRSNSCSRETHQSGILFGGRPKEISRMDL